MSAEAKLRRARWFPIETAPRYQGEGDVPLEYTIVLYDPDNSIERRVQVGMWNHTRGGFWQSLMDNMTIERPTKWTHFFTTPGRQR